MTFRYPILIPIFIIVSFNKARSQTDDVEIRQQVLQLAIKDSLFVFGHWSEQGDTETHLRYLGQVTTQRYQTYKILNSIWYWGLSRRATSRILIYDSQNRFVGNYYISLVEDLPTHLKNGKLYFGNNKHPYCDSKIVSQIDLEKGLPKQFFRKCRGDSGDIYVFE